MEAEEYKISMLPKYYPDKLTAMITPLAKYLSEETGENITPVLTDNFDQYEKKILSGDIQIGYQNPLVYVNVSKESEVLATAVQRHGGDKFRGIIIVRPDSDIRGVIDLRDRSIMIVSKNSAGGYLSQKLTLQEQGIPLTKKQLVEAAGNRHENVIIAVSVGSVEAGFIRESALRKADKYIMPGSIKVLTATTWFPNWAFSVNRDLPDNLKKSLREAVLKLDKNHPVLQAIGLVGFKSATDGDYDIIRKIIADN